MSMRHFRLWAVWAGPARNAHLDGPPLLHAETGGSTPLRIIENIEAKRAGFQSLTEAIDTMIPAGRMMIRWSAALRNSSAR